MGFDIIKLQQSLCDAMCATIRIVQRTDSLFLIETPFFFADGDPYQIYIKELPNGQIRLSDMGHTLMQLSYDNDTDKFREGTRGKVLEQIKTETLIEESDGEFFIDTKIIDLPTNIFRLGQAITKITDLTFLNRERTASTFYEDLKEQLFNIVDESLITTQYYYTDMENALDYPIDYKIEGRQSPIFLFGIPNRDKAMLTTIILERLLRAQADFDSLLIFSDQKTIPKNDLARLSNAGGEMIASLDAETDFSRKILRKINLS